MEFSASCQFLEFWFQGNDSETKAVVHVFICHTDRSSYFMKFIFEKTDSQQ